MQIEELPTERVFSRPDARNINGEALRGLTESIRQIGVINPLRVRRTHRTGTSVEGECWEVTAGHHRLRAVLELGLATVPCVVADEDDLHAELAMIDENLMRSELSTAQRAKQTARRKEIYEELYPETRQGAYNRERNRSRQDGDFPSPNVVRFTRDAAARTGRSERAIQRDVERGEAIASEVLDRIADTCLDNGKYIDGLKKLGVEEQRARVQRDLHGSKARPAKPTVRGAGERDAYQTWLAKVMRAFHEGSPEWKERARESLYPESPIMDRRFR